MGQPRQTQTPRTYQDVTVSNGLSSVVGLGGLYIQNNGTASGIFFIDANGFQAQCLPAGGDISGTPDQFKIVVINSGTPINASQVAARIHARM